MHWHSKIIDLYRGQPEMFVKRLANAKPIFVKDWVDYESPVLYARQYRVEIPALPQSLHRSIDKFGNPIPHLFTEIDEAREFLGERIFKILSPFNPKPESDRVLRVFLERFAGFNPNGSFVNRMFKKMLENFDALDLPRTALNKQWRELIIWAAGFKRPDAFLRYYYDHLESHLRKVGLSKQVTTRLIQGRVRELVDNAFIHGHVLSDVDFYRGFSHEQITIRHGLIRISNSQARFWVQTFEFGEYVDLDKILFYADELDIKLGLRRLKSGAQNQEIRETVSAEKVLNLNFQHGLKAMRRISVESNGSINFLNTGLLQENKDSIDQIFSENTLHLAKLPHGLKKEPVNSFYWDEVVDWSQP